MIKVNNVSYSVGKKEILNDVSFEAKQGEITAIIGANGAGKSTLLKLLCNEMPPSAGQVLFDGKGLNSYPLKELARRRSVLTQHNTLSLSFTVKELVLMGRYPHFDGQPTEHDLQMVIEAMQATGITMMAGRTYETLSGGEQQRVQLARVIAQIQDIPNGWLLLDEPTNGLDLLHQQQLLIQARAMADKGYGVICILHDINLAAAYADQMLILKQGKMQALGSPNEVINCENIYDAFGIKVQLIQNENFKCPLVITTGIINYA
ncbi:heme ABC transporter ATP-binding protein [Mucilaginibacter polytrichastri]|uniref:Hemin import ATP-binding protein HmuV n=1 Tax=Mucilaginibacter polytrichastri TaxID=1302689 RepID=A0A1Q5ZXV1_9SPHI|nr:heme ABC transporter ATP-binding protein [Mucilaginibacter polytrichastri]OKS86579.1 Hemin import ATP-binding protein HmuV [Mucilaginibacter polytrichastri]SFS80383.1 iron complex transport system ATP-binding protein [Mucilaginibacter polytrichastri]